MKSSNLFKMLVVAIALQSSSNVFSMDLLGDNGLQGLINQYKDGNLEVVPALLKEMSDNISAHRQQFILEAFGVDLNRKESRDSVFRRIRSDIEAAQKLAAKQAQKPAKAVVAQKSKTQRAAEFIINNKKAIGGAVAIVAIGAAVYKREALKKAASDLASNVANSSYVKSAMERGSAVKASASAMGASVYASASDKLASVGNAVKAKLPSMPNISMPKFSMPKLSNPFAKSVATATVGAAASAVTQTATATTPVVEAVIPDVEPVAYAVESATSSN